MTRLVYTEEELLREPEYAAPHEVAGYRLHGGFDAEGRYLSPRSAVRPAAVRAWQESLRERGCEILPADPTLLVAGAWSTYPQSKLMLSHGLTQGLWNALTVTGVIEARGRALVDLRAPDYQRIVEEDLSGTAVGHLNKGLLEAHGLDEGGDPSRGLGGHDDMWFAIRDLALGRDRHPKPKIPENIGRPDEGRLAPDLPEGHERMLLLLMNVLMIEVRAESVFSRTEKILLDPDLLTDNREGAELAAVMVQRIRQDEEIHVEYLRTVLSELRSVTFRGQDGEPVPGAKIIDPMWKVLVHWHAIENPRLAREQGRPEIRARILRHPDGEAILEDFLALEPPDPFSRAA